MILFDASLALPAGTGPRIVMLLLICGSGRSLAGVPARWSRVRHGIDFHPLVRCPYLMFLVGKMARGSQSIPCLKDVTVADLATVSGIYPTGGGIGGRDDIIVIRRRRHRRTIRRPCRHGERRRRRRVQPHLMINFSYYIGFFGSFCDARMRHAVLRVILVCFINRPSATYAYVALPSGKPSSFGVHATCHRLSSKALNKFRS